MKKKKRIDKLMVVAHPDDETLFGGQELLTSKNWLVVCLTNGNNISRKNQFSEAIEKAEAQGIIWEYPDHQGLSKEPNQARTGWLPFFEEVKEKLKEINKKYTFKKVVTHNVTGEYGHEHHKMVHELVIAVFAKELIYCFGIGQQIQEHTLAQKLEFLEIYSNQFSESAKKNYAIWINQSTIYPYC